MALPALNGTRAADWRLEATRGDNFLPTSHQNKQRRRGETAEPGSGPQPVGRSAGTHRGLAVLWNDSMLLMFFLRLLLSSCGRNKLLSTGSWRGSLSSTDPASTQLEPGFVHQLVNSLFGSCWGNLFSSRFQV